MRAMRPTLIGIALVMLLPAVGRAQDDEAGLVLETVADGVWAVVRPSETRFDAANAAVIVTDRDVVLVDPPPEAAAARWLLETLRARTEKPVRYIVDTHWHGDHTFGHAAIRAAFPAVEIIANRTVAEDLDGRARVQLDEEIEAWSAAIGAARQRLAQGVDREGQALDEAGVAQLAKRIEAAEATVEGKRATEIVLPTLLIDGPMVIERGTRRLEILPFRAHTRGDLVVYLPADRVLISGDVVDDLPFAGHGEIGSWIATLDVLAALDVDAIIPGHGPVFRDTRRIAQIRDLLGTALAQAEAARSKGLEGEAAKAAFDLERFRGVFVAEADAAAARNFDGFVPALIDRALAEVAERSGPVSPATQETPREP